jgi:hypothetical protein
MSFWPLYWSIRHRHYGDANMSRKAMKLALEALESDPVSHAGLVNRKQAITALRQALETQWVGLTDEQIEDAWQSIMAAYIEEVDESYWSCCDFEFARAIEAKLKEKNHG